MVVVRNSMRGRNWPWGDARTEWDWRSGNGECQNRDIKEYRSSIITSAQKEHSNRMDGTYTVAFIIVNSEGEAQPRAKR